MPPVAQQLPVAPGDDRRHRASSATAFTAFPTNTSSGSFAAWRPRKSPRAASSSPTSATARAWPPFVAARASTPRWVSRPAGGLMMGTRTGDLDPGVIDYLLREKKSRRELSELIYQRSGLKGVSGTSSDMRDLLASSEISRPAGDRSFLLPGQEDAGLAGQRPRWRRDDHIHGRNRRECRAAPRRHLRRSFPSWPDHRPRAQPAEQGRHFDPLEPRLRTRDQDQRGTGHCPPHRASRFRLNTSTSDPS